MNIIVCVKQIFDLDQVRINPDTREPILEGVPKILDEMSKKALEAALRIKENKGGKVTVISAGTSDVKKTIKESLAMGADEAVIVADNEYNSDPSLTAEILAELIKRIGEYDLILLGDASSDEYSGQTGPRIAEILKLPLIAYVREINLNGGQIICARDLEDCYEIVSVTTPCVITVTTEINEPRIPSLKDILKASKKPVKVYTIKDLGLEDKLKNKDFEIVENRAPEIHRKRMIIEKEPAKAVEELIMLLKKEGIWR